MASNPSISYGETNTNWGAQVGVSNGTINVFQEVQERSEPRPDPLLIIPFPRDPDFIGRKELLDQIHEKATAAGSRIAIVGIGGIGKTQLAVEYCHQVRQQSIATWVFWVHASNAARCEKSLRDIANRAKIPGHQESNANVFQIVGNWLQDGNIGKWVLVLDNVDDDELLRRPGIGENDPSSQPPLRKLLESSTGTIIVTSRNRGVALDIVGRTENIVAVQPMNQTEALDLLQRKLSPLAEHDQGRELAQELEYMPLAIVQAAGYIQSRLPRCSVSQYLLKLRKSDREAVRMLREEAGLLHRDWEAKNSILLTWQISFDYIRKRRSSATDLLSLMSFFDRQGITESILRAVSNEDMDSKLVNDKPEGISGDDTDTESNSTTDTSFEKDFMMLSDFSLISIGSDNAHSTSFTMHRLVQLTVRTWLKVYGQLEHWKEKSIDSLYLEFPTGEYGNWEKCRSLFPHVKAAVLNQPTSREALEKWATVLYNGAWYAYESGHFTESVEMAYMSRDCRSYIFGEESRMALRSTTMLASAYGRQGRWKEAADLNRRVLEIHKTTLGEDHPDTLSSMGRLASMLWSQARLDEAEQLEIQVMETSKAKLGMEHPDTIISMANRALTLSSKGQWEEAEKLQRYVLETQIKLDEDHPDTQINMSNLAVTLQRLGDHEEAEKLQRQLLSTQKMKLGADHPDTLLSMTDLAFTLWEQGQFEEANDLQRHVFEIRKTKLGPEHPETLISISNLAMTLKRQGRQEQAERLQRHVLETHNKTLGVDHPDTLNSMANLALTIWQQGRFEETEELETQVLEIRERNLGTDHPDTLSSMSSLAHTLNAGGQKSKAIDMMRTCVSRRQKILGLAHPATEADSTVLVEWETENLTVDPS